MCKLLLTAGLCLIIASLASSSRLVCYYNSLSEQRVESGKFGIHDIDPNKCTHLIFTFSDISSANALVPKRASDYNLYHSFNALKSRNPLLKTLLAVGDTHRFNTMVATQYGRRRFIQSAITLLRTYGFDGLSLDWWFPATAGSQSNNKQKFTLLIKELKAAFAAEATKTLRDRLFLIASVSAEKAVIDASYEVKVIAGHLDFINVLTFDFHGSLETVALHHSPLYKGSHDTGDKIYSNADYGMQYWEDQGAPADKLNLGIASYGRVYTLTSTCTGVGAPVTVAGREGNYTRMKGMWAYYEICPYLDSVQVQLIADQKVPYLIVDNQWVGYDNKDSLDAKVNYVTKNYYGGVFVWSLDLDDFSGHFCKGGKYPLISHLHHLLVPDYPDYTTITTTTKTVTHNFCRRRVNGFHPNPYNQNSFYICANGKTYTQYCATALIFNPHCKCCDFPERVAHAFLPYSNLNS